MESSTENIIGRLIQAIDGCSPIAGGDAIATDQAKARVTKLSTGKDGLPYEISVALCPDTGWIDVRIKTGRDSYDMRVHKLEDLCPLIKMFIKGE